VSRTGRKKQREEGREVKSIQERKEGVTRNKMLIYIKKVEPWRRLEGEEV
jgi:hypothetical protein